MKKIVSLCLCVIMMTGMLTACGSLDAEESTVYVKKNGSITDLIVESFDKEYYDTAELETFISEEIDAYKAENSDASVKADEVSVEEGIAKVTMEFGSHEDYAGFNGVEFFAGTVVQAMAAGYDFNEDFYPVDESVSSANATENEASVTEGEGSDAAQTAAVGKDVILDNSDYKVVITEERVNVKVSGDILYVSDAVAERTEKDTVELPTDENAAEGDEKTLVYIIYK